MNVDWPKLAGKILCAEFLFRDQIYTKEYVQHILLHTTYTGVYELQYDKSALASGIFKLNKCKILFDAEYIEFNNEYDCSLEIQKYNNIDVYARIDKEVQHHVTNQPTVNGIVDLPIYASKIHLTYQCTDDSILIAKIALENTANPIQLCNYIPVHMDVLAATKDCVRSLHQYMLYAKTTNRDLSPIISAMYAKAVNVASAITTREVFQALTEIRCILSGIVCEIPTVKTYNRISAMADCIQLINECIHIISIQSRSNTVVFLREKLYWMVDTETTTHILQLIIEPSTHASWILQEMRIASESKMQMAIQLRNIGIARKHIMHDAEMIIVELIPNEYFVPGEKLCVAYPINHEIKINSLRLRTEI
jgi:hypothetical protein